MQLMLCNAALRQKGRSKRPTSIHGHSYTDTARLKDYQKDLMHAVENMYILVL